MAKLNDLDRKALKEAARTREAREEARRSARKINRLRKKLLKETTRAVRSNKDEGVDMALRKLHSITGDGAYFVDDGPASKAPAWMRDAAE